MTRYTRTKKTNPVWYVVFGAAMLVIGISVLVYTQVKYAHWAEVKATYTLDNCHKKETTQTNKGRTRHVTKTFCDAEISYKFEGIPYSHTQTNVDISRDMPEKRLVNPKNPQTSVEISSNHTISLICIVVGLIFTLLGVFLKKVCPTATIGNYRYNHR